MQNFVQSYLELVKKKNQLTQSTYNSSEYLNGLENEIKEVVDELKKQNHVYLEDELGDILRDYINLLHQLSQEGYISSPESVLAKSLKKYQDRVQGMEKGTLRNDTKQKQKNQLKQEHEEHYGK